MNYVPTEQEITMMKNNKEAFCFWPEHLQEWAGENWSFMEIRHKGSWQLPWFSLAKADDAIVLRLRTDYELPKPERWFCNHKAHRPDAPCLHNGDGLCTKCIEIPAADVEYVKKCIELHKAGKVNLDEFEFRALVDGKRETWIIPCSLQEHTDLIADQHLKGLLFVRKPEKKVESKAVIEWLERTLAELKGDVKC